MTDNTMYNTIATFDKMDTATLEAEYEYWADRTYWAMRTNMRPIEIAMFHALAIAALHAIR